MKKNRIISFLLTLLCSAFFVSCGMNYSAVYFQNNSEDFSFSGNGVDEDTVFELGSCGKTVAAYTALSLVDEGKLDLNQKIKPYLDAKLITEDARLDEITVKQLLCHTAGFSPSYELGIDKKIYSEPGKEFRYSGVGYIYLQNVIEKASGMSFEEAASHYVFEPLGMKNSTFENASIITPYMNAGNAVLYALVVFVLSFIVLLIISCIIGKIVKRKNFKFRSAYLFSFVAAGIINVIALCLIMSKVLVLFIICYALMGIVLFITRKKSKLFNACVPVIVSVLFILGFTLKLCIPVTNELISKGPNCAFSLKSTAKDMSLFCNALMKKQKSTGSIFSEMFNPAVKIDDKNSWGLGIAIENSSQSGTTYWHSGINPGAQSLFVLYPDQDKYIIVLTNSDNGLELSKQKAREFLGFDGEWDIRR